LIRVGRSLQTSPISLLLIHCSFTFTEAHSSRNAAAAVTVSDARDDDDDDDDGVGSVVVMTFFVPSSDNICQDTYC